MDEERVVQHFGRTGKITVEFILKALMYFNESNKNIVQFMQNMQPNDSVSGEMTWDKLMKSSDVMTIQDLQSTEVNLDKLKVELEKYGIGFAFYKHPDSNKVSMAYAVKHKDIVSKAFEDTISKIVKNPEGFSRNIKKDEKNMNVEEKLKYYKQKTSDFKANKTVDPKMSKESAFEDFFFDTAKNTGGKSI